MINRKIIFRGLDENGKWAYGSLINNMWTFSELTERSGQNVCEIITGKYDSDNWAEAIEEETNLISVRPETVGEFTGINDELGMEICEGDICSNEVAKWIIIFETGCFCGKRIGGSDGTQNVHIALRAIKGLEIIGNIHQNPELS